MEIVLWTWGPASEVQSQGATSGGSRFGSTEADYVQFLFLYLDYNGPA